jgi:hypothetical protein
MSPLREGTQGSSEQVNQSPCATLTSTESLVRVSSYLRLSLTLYLCSNVSTLLSLGYHFLVVSAASAPSQAIFFPPGQEGRMHDNLFSPVPGYKKRTTLIQGSPKYNFNNRAAIPSIQQNPTCTPSAQGRRSRNINKQVFSLQSSNRVGRAAFETRNTFPCKNRKYRQDMATRADMQCQQWI